MFFAGSSMRIAFRIRGSLSASNATSTVGPITCTTFPMFCAMSLAPRVNASRCPRVNRLLEGFRSTHDVEQFLGDHRLPQPVALQREPVDQLAGVLARR